MLASQDRYLERGSSWESMLCVVEGVTFVLMLLALLVVAVTLRE